MPPRILITGSRDWADEQAIRDALLAAWKDLGKDPDTVLVSGACRTGADALAEARWRKNGLTVEPHPVRRADWERYGGAAGPMRNQAMVDLGADICLAFILDDSRGASGCARAAEHAGIPVRRFEARS